MTARYSVYLDGAAPALAAEHREALASLPAHFHLAGDPSADVVLAAEDGISPGRLGTVLDGAALLSPPPAGTGVAVPALRFAQRIPDGIPRADWSIIDCALTVAPGNEDGPAIALLEQMVLLQLLTDAQPSLRAWRATDGGVLAELGVSGGDCVVVAAVATSPSGPSLELSAAARDCRIEISMQAGNARPPRIAMFNAANTSLVNAPYQSALRLTWSRLHRAIASGQQDKVEQSRVSVLSGAGTALAGIRGTK